MLFRSPELLGPPRFLREEKLEDSQIGVVQGLAWTQAGGEVLQIEALKMKGKGHLALTGQLGDVMKESAHAAMSYCKAHMEELGIPDDFFEKYDIHVHLPAGAIPKDGPSAGVTLLTSMASLFLKRTVSPKLAMTGEITLRGAVTPVGGVKEKIIAAHRAGVTEIILSEKNRKDIKDIPDDVKSEIKFHFVEHINEVLKVALGFDFPLDRPGEFLFTPGPSSMSSGAAN